MRGGKNKFECKKFETNKIEKSRCSEANKFEFEFKGLEMNKTENQGEGKKKCLNLKLKGWN